MCHTAAVHLNYQKLLLEVSTGSSSLALGGGIFVVGLYLCEGIMLFTLQRESSWYFFAVIS